MVMRKPQLGHVLMIDVSQDFEFTILPSHTGTTQCLRLARLPEGWCLSAPRGTSQYGFWDGLSGSRTARGALTCVAKQRPTGGCSGSDVMEVRSGFIEDGFRSALRAELKLDVLLAHAAAIELPGGSDCRLKCFSAWEGNEVDEPTLARLLTPFLNAQPYLASGDERTTRMVLDCAYETELSEYKGGLDDCDFRSLLVAYSNLSAAAVVMIADDSDGRGPGSLTSGIAASSCSSISKQKATARDRAHKAALAGVRLGSHLQSSCFVSREAIRPLRSLSGWRAHATGSYAVHLRWHRQHVQPMILYRGARQNAICSPGEFWGNNNCTQWSAVKGFCPALLRLDCTHVVDSVTNEPECKLLHRMKPEEVLTAPTKCRINIKGPEQPLTMTEEHCRCQERWAHRGKRGFQGPDRCRICCALDRESAKHRTLMTLTKNGPEHFSLAVRGNAKIARAIGIERACYQLNLGQSTHTLTPITVECDAIAARHAIVPATLLRRAASWGGNHQHVD